MKRKKANIHRGQILKKIVEETRLNKDLVATKAGYTRSSYYKHIQDAELPYHILIHYGKAIRHDFTIELPEMPKYLLEEPDTRYEKNITLEEALYQRDNWKDKYLDLLEKYNRLIEERMAKKPN